MRSLLMLFALLLVPLPLAAQATEIGDAPGQLVRVDGKRLHLHCIGSGSPAVVIEAGASSFAIDFSLVQPRIAQMTRVCAYDRLGHGWSDAGEGRDAGVAETLHALLEAAGESPPYVLVGASRGGLYIRVFARRFPDDVVGLVLVDPASEERLFTTYNGESAPIASLSAEELRTTLTPGPPVAIPRREPQTDSPFDRLSPEQYKTRVALDEKLIASFPDSVPFSVVAAAVEEERALLAELWQLTRATEHPLGRRPLIVLSRGVGTNENRITAFNKLAGLSSNSRHTVVAESGHEIHLFRPDVVVEAVMDVLEAVRSNSMLRRR